MKFSNFPELKRLNNLSIEQVLNYLTIDLPKVLRDLSFGLTRLSFSDNFRSFKVTVTIPASSELAIRNEFRDSIPTERIIVRGNSNSVVDGDSEWTKDYVYLKNTTGSEVTVTVRFLA